MTRLNELEEQIKILNLENESLVERAEEIELMALISEKLKDIDKIEDLYKIVLERISIVKTIPYCGVYRIEKNEPIKVIDYSYLYNDSKIVESFSFTKIIFQKIKAKGHLFINQSMKDFNKIKIKFRDKYFIPDCFLLISCKVSGENGFFLFADNCSEHNLSEYIGSLIQIVSLAESKATNIILLDYINKQNENLEQLVEEKSEELYESEAKFRELIELLPDAIIVHHNMIIEFVNPSAVKLLEAESEEELLGKSIIDFIGTEWKAAIRKKIKNFKSGRNGERSPFTEFMITTLKGKRIFVESSGTNFYQFGKDRIQIIIRNISERKLAEKKLKESEEKFRIAFETSPDAIAISRLDDGTYVSINKGFEKATGFTNEELKGVSTLKMDIWKNPEDREKLVKGLERDGVVDNLKADFRLKKGTIIRGLLSARVIDLGGVPHLLSTTRDITGQEESKKIIENQNKFLSSIINSLSYPFLVIDPEDYTILLANPAASQGQDLIGKKCCNTYYNHHNKCEGSEFCPLTNIKKTMKPDMVMHERIDSNGDIQAFEVHGHPIIDNNGKLIQMIEYAIDVSEKKKSLTALKGSEEKFRLLFEKAAIGLVLLDNSGKIVNANKSALSIFELRRNEILGKFGMSLFSEEELKRLPPQINTIFTKGSVEIEREYVTSKGKEKFLELLGSKLSDELIIISIIDLTEMKLSAEKLKASEKKFKSLIEQSPVGILIQQHERIIFANNALAETLGFKNRDELLGKKIIDFVHPDFKKIAHSRMKLLFSNGKTANSAEENLICRDGKIINVLVVEQAIEFEGQRAIQEYIYDITEDKKLREENRILKSGIECLEETAVIVLDNEEKITYSNTGFTNIYGYTQEESIGKEVSIVKSFKMSKDFYNIFEKNIQERKFFNGELLNKTKDNTIINAEVSRTPIFSQNNKFLGYIEIHKDITKRRKAETELWEAKVAAEQADKVKSEFLAQMSHEIRTPINAIVSFSSLLKDELQDIVSDDLKTSFSLIDRAGYRIIRTIDLLLNLSEVQTGTYQCILRKLNLYDDILATQVVNYKYAAKAKNILLNIKVETENLIVNADIYALEQIFKNIIDNGIKYTSEGKVEIIVSEMENHLQVKISDTGIGISKEYLPKIFDPFSQEESGYTRSFEGNGIGLALTMEYCRMNGIDISVESEKGKGTTFVLRFAG